MLWIILAQVEYGPAAEDWKQYRHDYRRTGRTPLRAICSSPSELYDVVHGSLDLSIIATRVNGGADHDIISAERYNGVAAKDGATGSHIWGGFSESFTSPGIASVAASDQFVFANGYYSFWVLRLTDGLTVYSYDKPDARDASPLIADINSDGCPEVFTSFGNIAFSINGCATSYTTNWTYTLPASAFAPALLRIGGSWFVAYPASNGFIYVLNASTGTLHSSFNASVPSAISSYPDYTIATGNLDGVGDDEIVVPRTSSVAVYRWTGSSWTTLWSVSGLSDVSPVALGDKDGDGLEDVWVVAGGELRVYKGNNGTLLGQTSGLGVAGRYGSAHAPTLFDFNGDGTLDALVPYNYYYVRAVNGATMSIIGTFWDTPYSITSEVIVIKLSSTEVGFSVGDYSCHITTWGRCVLGYDDGTAVEEREIKGRYEILRDGIRVSGDMEVVVYSINGKEVKRYRVEGESFINLSDLPKGVYMVKIGREVVKFVRM
jgi:hypothetical protein